MLPLRIRKSNKNKGNSKAVVGIVVHVKKIFDSPYRGVPVFAPYRRCANY